jgi:hypothetical protein
MKFNWGTMIAIVYLLFVGGMMFLVVQSSRQKIDLVTPDYYEQEIKYQERIDQSKRADALNGKLMVDLLGDTLILRFPAEQAGKPITGKAWIYYPADETLDVKAVFETRNGQHLLVLPTTDDRTGMSIVKTGWTCEGIDYYTENILPPHP